MANYDVIEVPWAERASWAVDRGTYVMMCRNKSEAETMARRLRLMEEGRLSIDEVMALERGAARAA